MGYIGVLDEVPSFAQSFARNFSQGLSRGISRGADFAQKMALQKARRNTGPSEQELVEAGFSPEEAKMYSTFSVGGRTQFAKELLEERKRGLTPDGRLQSEQGNQDQMFSDIMSKLSENGQEGEFTEKGAQRQESELADRAYEEIEERETENNLDNYIKGQDKGLTPAEKVRRGTERYKSGKPIYDAAGNKLREFSKIKRNLGILDDLAKSKKLPSYFGRLNVDSDGNLKLPFASSPEAQRFVKIINEFASGAKDTYGSRVTNFDLAQYLKQFPNLMNSEQGIKDLIEHINLTNDINSVYYKNLKNVFDKAGGVRNIDSDVAESLAEKMSEKQTEKLSEKFKNIGTLEKLPPAHKNKGQQFQDEETGEIYTSDGSSWIKQGK